MEGDLAQMSPTERLLYVKSWCQSLRIDWRGRPFAYISLNGKLVMYALRNCTDQLRKVWGVSVVESRRSVEGELVIIEVKVQDRSGRTDTGTGAWPASGFKGETGVNAILKAETKAKRRATLSICGLGMLDASELDTFEFDEVTPSGRIVEVVSNEKAQLEAGKARELAVLMAQGERDSQLPFKERVERHQAELRKQTPEQIEILLGRFAGKEKTSPAPAATEPARKEEGAAKAGGPPTQGAAAGAAPPVFDGLTLQGRADGSFEILGPKALLRANWPILSAFWNQTEQRFFATAADCGKLLRRFEEAKPPVAHRLVPYGGISG